MQNGTRTGHFAPTEDAFALMIEADDPASGIDRRYFGALIHGSVCRDFLEPATACRVHHGLELPNEAIIYDVSNACLGLLNGIIQVASMIELGQIRSGVIVSTESGRDLVENTISRLNSDESLTRESIKDSIASLTIGSASVAIVLCDEELSRTGNRLTGGAVYCDTSHHELCRSRGLETMMDTDSEMLMRQGIATGVETFRRFLGVEPGRGTQERRRVFLWRRGIHQHGGALA